MAKHGNFERAIVLLAFGLGVAGCGGSDDKGGGADETIEPATPPSDVCALLTLSDVQTILPDAVDGMLTDSVPDGQDGWVRSCEWDGAGDASVELVVYGALTSAGKSRLDLVDTGPGYGIKEPVSGIGEHATYWVDDAINTLGLIARSGSYAAGVTAYFVEPPPSKEALIPLVQKAVGGL